jgi:hypothetical protein
MEDETVSFNGAKIRRSKGEGEGERRSQAAHVASTS